MGYTKAAAFDNNLETDKVDENSTSQQPSKHSDHDPGEGVAGSERSTLPRTPKTYINI